MEGKTGEEEGKAGPGGSRRSGGKTMASLPEKKGHGHEKQPAVGVIGIRLSDGVVDPEKGRPEKDAHGEQEKGHPPGLHAGARERKQ
jgi:hypothetical protein